MMCCDVYEVRDATDVMGMGRRDGRTSSIEGTDTHTPALVRRSRGWYGGDVALGQKAQCLSAVLSKQHRLVLLERQQPHNH